MKDLIKDRQKQMKEIPVMDSDFDSSNVHSIGYDEPNKILYVRFWGESKSKRSQVPGPLYKYLGVEKRLYLQFYYAKSKGEFVWERLRERYRYILIGRKGWRGPTVKKKSRPNSMNPARHTRRKGSSTKKRPKKPAAAR